MPRCSLRVSTPPVKSSLKKAFEKLYKTAAWNDIAVPNVSPEPRADPLPPRAIKRKLSEILKEAEDDGAPQLPEAEQCSICYQSIDETGDHRRIELPCKHAFGLSCMVTWCTSRNSPPPESQIDVIQGDPQDDDEGSESLQQAQCPVCRGVFTIGVGEAGELDEMVTGQTKTGQQKDKGNGPDEPPCYLSKAQAALIQQNRVKALAKKVARR